MKKPKVWVIPKHEKVIEPVLKEWDEARLRTDKKYWRLCTQQ